MLFGSCWLLPTILLFSNVSFTKVFAFSSTTLLNDVKDFTDQHRRALLEGKYNAIIIKQESFRVSQSIFESTCLADSFDSIIENMIDIEEAMELLIPEYLRNVHNLTHDIYNHLNMMKSLKLPGEKLSCRFNMFNGRRCPKWHEDNVKFRLLKTYVGPGTEWVDPGYIDVRLLNFGRKIMDLDLCVDDRSKIEKLCTGDALIMRGKHKLETEPKALPVLHRSPTLSGHETCSITRVLLTISIT